MPSAPVKELLGEVLAAVGPLASLDDLLRDTFGDLAEEQLSSLKRIVKRKVNAQEALSGARYLTRGILKQLDGTAEADMRQVTPEQREALLVQLAEAVAVKLVAAAALLDDYARAQAAVVALKRAADAEPAEKPGGLPGETNPRRLKLVADLKQARATREVVEAQVRKSLEAAGKAAAGEW